MKMLSAQKRKDYAGPALHAFFNIAKAWKLNHSQICILLGLSTESTFYNWKKKPTQAVLNNDTIERLSYIFGIYKALQILLPNPMIADNWVNLPNNNTLFNGQKPLERMLQAHVVDLYLVRRYLDTEQGGLW